MSDKENEIKFSNWFLILLCLIYSVGITLVVIACFFKASDFKYIIFAAIFMVIALAVALLMLEISKPFVKMAFLKGILESNANAPDIIKKVCDTLAEL